MKKITLHYTPPNNHGCRGEGVVVNPLSCKRGLVVESWSCGPSCPLSRDYDDLEPGQIVALPGWWRWDRAAKEDNSFVDTEGCSLCGSTRVRPRELTIK